MQERKTIVNAEVDFWLLGGLSICLCLLLALANFFRSSSNPIGLRFQQLPATFALLCFLVNNPHFMISYKFGYGRGFKFVGQHWFRLALLPALLLASYGAAYFYYLKPFPHLAAFEAWANFWGIFHIEVIRGSVDNMGQAIMSITVWLMYLTVGWHYAKQCLGCMLIYSKYDDYPVTYWQRELLKINLFSLAFYYFLYSMEYMDAIGTQAKFFNIPMLQIFFPYWIHYFALSIVGISLCAVIYFFFFVNWKKYKRWPSRNFLVPMLSIYAWWVPITEQREYYVFAVPFFHSLQYLLFAQRLARHRARFSINPLLAGYLSFSLLIVCGFFYFEWLPYAFDRYLGTEWNQSTGFFVLSFLVFINIHHYFIDSVIWKFHQGEVREALLDSDSQSLTYGK